MFDMQETTLFLTYFKGFEQVMFTSSVIGSESEYSAILIHVYNLVYGFIVRI